MSTDLFAEQKRRQNERLRIELAKSKNDISARTIMVDVGPEMIVTSSLARPEQEGFVDFRSETLLADDPQYGGGVIRTWKTGKEDPRHEFAFVLGSAYDAALWLDRATRAWLKALRPFTLIIFMKNEKVPSAYYALTVNCIDWLFLSEAFGCMELKRNESIPAMLGRFDPENPLPNLNSLKDMWFQYLSQMDVFMHSQNYVMYSPEKPIKIRRGNIETTQRVRIVKSMSGMNREMMRSLRAGGFEFSRQHRQWQSVWTGKTDEAVEAMLREAFSSVEYLPLETLGFLPEYRARNHSVSTRSVRFHPETWDILLGQSGLMSSRRRI